LRCGNIPDVLSRQTRPPVPHERTATGRSHVTDAL
jgi:hypothetical protein